MKTGPGVDKLSAVWCAGLSVGWVGGGLEGVSRDRQACCLACSGQSGETLYKTYLSLDTLCLNVCCSKLDKEKTRHATCHPDNAELNQTMYLQTLWLPRIRAVTVMLWIMHTSLRRAIPYDGRFKFQPVNTYFCDTAYVRVTATEQSLLFSLQGWLSRNRI